MKQILGLMDFFNSKNYCCKFPSTEGFAECYCCEWENNWESWPDKEPQTDIEWKEKKKTEKDAMKNAIQNNKVGRRGQGHS